MSIGPVQLILLVFPESNFHGEIIAESECLRETDTVRVIERSRCARTPTARSR
jgi:hypothetical protein